jgi:hypothetical protein
MPKGVPVLKREKKSKILKNQMTLIQAQIQQEDRQKAHRLKRNIKRLIHDQLNDINAWWLISFHYRDHHSKEDQLLQDVADLKRKLNRIIYKSRDKTIKGAGEYPYPKMLFFHETSHQGTGQFHTHLITEKFPQSLNTQYEMENLFHKRLPHKVKALSKWKSIDIQRINPDEPDYRRISSYLGKQTNLEMIALDPFNSDLSPQNK